MRNKYKYLLKTHLVCTIALLLVSFYTHAREIDLEEINIDMQYKVEEIEISQNDSVNHTFYVFDENASFPGGDEACKKWLASNVVYPEYCKTKGIEGRVIVSFVVDKDGSIDDIKTIQSPHELLSAEAIRVISSMPKWIPAKLNGKTIRSRFNLPIMFSFGFRKESNETIIQEYVSRNLNNNYEFHIVELGESQKFDFYNLKKEYEVPEIFTEEIEYNKIALNNILEFSKQKSIDSYIPVIIGTRIKGSENEWVPSWYLILMDANRNILNVFNYYP